MGAFFSVASIKPEQREWNEISPNETCKRQRMSPTVDEESPTLIPNLPDDLSLQIIARLPRICYFNVRLVSKRWKSTIMSSELYKLRKELGTTEEWLYLLIKVGENNLLWHALDPHSKTWQRVPNAFDEMPFCGCAIGAVDGCLYVLGGFSKTSTMRCVWRFDPIQNTWSKVTSMSRGRAYYKTGVLNNKLYVVGGVSQGQAGLVPLQSAEVFDPSTDTWSHVPSMPFSGAPVLPSAFLADMPKPVATGLSSYMGRLCVPQSLFSWIFVNVGGQIYDPETNSWIEMPAGMGEGWPVRQAGTKLSVVVDGELYAFDPSNSVDGGRIKVYDQGEDAWKVVIGKVPIYDSSDSESPYLLAGFHGKLHVITKDANHDIAILQAGLRDNLDS
ncbi:F-box/kelch-repeat protein [Glycine soja]|uniref:F-box/kelch-repeat protein n=1 Tax=Glycine soja TaxID=3848 RepID=A0A0B2QTL1_GLYSO|nr:F-box/kelch-repeat protein [Glycine soja]